MVLQIQNKKKHLYLLLLDCCTRPVGMLLPCSFYNYSFSTIHVAQKLSENSERPTHAWSIHFDVNLLTVQNWITALIVHFMFSIWTVDYHLFVSFFPSGLATYIIYHQHELPLDWRFRFTNQGTFLYEVATREGHIYLPEKDWTPRKREVTLNCPDKDHRKPAPF